MEDSIVLNLAEYKIMKSNEINTIKNKLNKDCLEDNDYLFYYNNIDKNNLSVIDNMRATSSCIGDFLIAITDDKKFDAEQIKNNLHNCLYNHKSCIFSCGANIKEYSNKFNT